MSGLDCPYLVRETIAYRESLDLSREARTHVVTAWQCAHPFHGIAVDLGDARGEVERHCAACRLPHAGEATSAGESTAPEE
jgi:hypothetical protein